MPSTKTLYRPVGLKEMALILQAEGEAFPPRLPDQPIFYPVLNRAYAEQIASEWNTGDKASGFAGFVTQFSLDADYLARFEEHVVGNSVHRELWVPAEDLEDFNQQIQGKIALVEAFYGERYVGVKHWYLDLHADEMLALFCDTAATSGMDFDSEVRMNRHAIQLNFNYWVLKDYRDRLPDETKRDVLVKLVDAWSKRYPETPLLGSESLA